MSTVYLNGAFLPAGEACVPVMDRGFLFGDGVYEVIPVFAGRLFRLSEHLARLDNSLAAIRLASPLAPEDWRGRLEELVRRNGGGDLSLYLQVTRGVAPGRDHAIPAGIEPTVFAACSPARRERFAPVRVITREDIRWLRCDIKAITLLPNILLKQEAADAGADDVILVRDGVLTEGAASNVFLVRGGRIVTPAKGPLLLPGVTRDLLVELARREGIPCDEAAVAEDALRDADEVWLTSSTREIMPVVAIDGVAVGEGGPGPVCRRMMELYEEFRTRFVSGRR